MITLRLRVLSGHDIFYSVAHLWTRGGWAARLVPDRDDDQGQSATRGCGLITRGAETRFLIDAKAAEIDGEVRKGIHTPAR